ncbi:hypothetical protein PCASD_18335 [Puccinia coronata f. sp. avenae]|uniref:DUF6589 domain-containing protein n=1 Tax=Puccinia coronata f. sp. avenae TaxID=200324 RepID=A0A2N5T3Z8_9BASI|nr:hypothetical protein PCASD_18335 [Puccinia coronata f. sp. avenae]
MNQYFHLLGLTSSRQTALIALKTLSKVAEKDLRSAMAANKSRPIGPSICIDNLDIEERVHSHSIRHCSMMFHGTWGYIHHPNPKLLSSLDPLELTLRAYYDALRKVSTMKINLQMLMPTCEEEKHFEQVLKSQLVHAMSQYVAKAANPEHALSSDPPTVETIDPTPPDIQMIQLMSQSDDSAEGTGQVAETLRKQFGLKPKDFVSCVQIMDANLATCKNFNSLRSLCTPSRYAKLRLSNLCFVLGASHTMWNISQAILNAHLGHPTSTHDLGAWHSLHALGIPSKKVIPKKDFTSMMNNIEKVHEASIVYCLRLVITSEEIVMPSEDAESPDQLPKLPTNKWIDIVEKCYSRFFSPQAQQNASQKENLKQHTFLMRLHNFSTIVKANRATKAGDIGRLMRIWKAWLLMAQALPGLVNYQSYLPRLVLMLNKMLPPSLSKLIRHNILVFPSGRENHFMPKENYLENQNYWLKFFYNSNGDGTKIN